MRYPVLQAYAELYLKIQQSRIALESRIKKLEERGVPEEHLAQLRQAYSQISSMEKQILEEAKEVIKDHPLWDFCQTIKGLGPVACLTFLGYIDIEKASSVGKVWKFCGYAVSPDGKAEKRVRGVKAGYNPLLKGRFWLYGRNIIMKRGEPYYSIYLEKKRYYETRPDRQDAKDKEKGWAMHNHMMALRWVVKLLLSHMWEICRRYEGLPVPPHRNYIPPPFPENYIRKKQTL